MIVIQLLLILLAVTFIVMLLRGRSTRSIRAWKKIGLLGLALIIIVVVLIPELANDAAHLVGVGRGADLLTYLLAMAFLIYALNDYLHRQEQKDIIIRLARIHAVNDAAQQYKNKLRPRR